MFSDPQSIVSQLGIARGAKVADFGAGSGFYSFAAGMAVGPDGRVYAVEVQKDLLTKLKNEANHRGIRNIETVWGDVEKLGGSHLMQNLVDWVFVANVFFIAPDRKTLVNEIKRVLKQNGRVLVVDWTASFGGMGPAPEHVFTETMARELFEVNGFTVETSISAGAEHYGIVFKKIK